MADKQKKQIPTTAQKEAQRKKIILRILGSGMLVLGIALVVGIFLLYRHDAKSNEQAKALESGSSDGATGTYEEVLKTYYTALVTENGEMMYHLMAPPAYWDYYMEAYSHTESEMISNYNQILQTTMTEWKAQYGEDATISYQIDGVSTQSEDFLTEWETEMNGVIGTEDALDAQQALTLHVTRTISGSLGKEALETTPTVIQVDGQWYILDEGVTDTSADTE